MTEDGVATRDSARASGPLEPAAPLVPAPRTSELAPDDAGRLDPERTKDLASDAAARAATARFARGPLLGAIVVALGWHLANNIPGSIARWSMLHHPSVAIALLVVFPTIGAIAALDALRGGHRRVLLPVLGILVLQAGVVVQFRTADPALALNVGDWAWPNFGWFAILVLWRWPLRWLWLALGANALISLGTLLDIRDLDRIELARFGMVVLGAGAPQVALAWAGRTLEAVARRAYYAASERAETLTALAAAEQVHGDRQRRYREVGHAVRALLADLAAGRLDTSDREVQRRCAVEASRLRRLIAEHDDTPDPLVHELRACADMAERRGVAVSLHAAGALPELSVARRRALTDLPMHVLAAARTQARVTVVASPEGDTEVSVVADADPDWMPMPVSGDVEAHFTRDGETLWVRTWSRHDG